jgi:GNAT superfamily N-acetyltransferase
MFDHKTSSFPNIQLRLADANDLNAIADIAKRTYRETFPHAEDTELLIEARFGKNFPETYRIELASKNVLYFLAIDVNTNKIIGYAKVVFNPEKNIAILDKMYILKIYQSRKIGAQLLQACFEKAIRRGVIEMHLFTNIYNENAIKFYKVNGFHKTKELVPPIPGGQFTKITDVKMVCNDITLFCNSFQPRPRL